MVLGTLIVGIVRWWLQIVQLMLLNPWPIFKILFLWFALSFAISHLFFIAVQKSDVVFIRRALGKEIIRACLVGLLVTSVLGALYQFILQNMLHSAFFVRNSQVLTRLSFVSSDFIHLHESFYFLLVLISGVLTMHFVGLQLSRLYQQEILDYYGWTMLVVSLCCSFFLWSINYVG